MSIYVQRLLAAAEAAPALNVFSFRAECLNDVRVWQRLLSTMSTAGGSVEITEYNKHFEIPDVVVEIYTPCSLETMLNVMRMVPDGHVMLQTLRACSKTQNSLERNYDAE